MTLVISTAYEGFCLPDEFMKAYGLKYKYTDDIERTDSRLIQWIHDHENNSDGLKCVELPENYTDYRIVEYDGMEWVYFVVNGKIYVA